MIGRRHGGKRVLPPIRGVTSQEVRYQVHIFLFGQVVGCVRPAKVSCAMLYEQAVESSLGASEKLLRAIAMFNSSWRLYISGATVPSNSTKSSSVNPAS